MDDPLYREILVRNVSAPGALFGTGKTLCLGLQNPSTAGVEVNDPTIHVSMKMASRLGFARLVVTNTYLRRFTHPKLLYHWLGQLTLGERDHERGRAMAIMAREALAADMFIAGWGNGHQDDEHWPSQLADLLSAEGIAIYCMGVNKNGTPKHPLARGRNRIPADQQPILWRAPKPHAAVTLHA